MSPSDALRTLIGKIPAWLLVALAAGGFWVLSRGMTLGSGSITGYAEEQLHTVGPLQAGRLKAVLVKLGQPVKAGEVVAQIDSRPLELRRARLQAELAQAKAQLVAEQDLQSALLQRNQLQAVRTHATEERSRAELRELDLQVQRLQGLGAEHLVRASEIEEARRRQRSVLADLQARPVGTPRELELMGLRPRPQADQAQRLEERLGPYRAAVVVGEAALRELEYELGELTLRAPADGTVGAILQRPGDALGAGAPVVSVITTRPGYVVAYVPERQLRSLGAGAAVQLRRAGVFTRAIPGHVSELAPMLEELPLRARSSPAVLAWGRRVVIVLDSPVPLLPGEAFRVSAR